ALVIALIGWAIEGIFGKKVTPFGRGIVGFLVSALVIYLAQFIVGGVSVSVLGALLAALVIGIIDLFIPVSTPFEAGKSRKE
ncbi:phage holin family protein, partial [Clostridium perfringens]